MLDWSNVNGMSVLIVDDEPDNLEVIADSLRFFGMTVEVATNGIAALDALQRTCPSLIMLDLSMPKMDGWETLKHIRANPKTHAIPVMALSAHAMPGDRQRALNVGFDGYMSKPVNIPTLMRDLREALKAKS
jgi:two-component system, cell cycle response regulator DivK